MIEYLDIVDEQDNVIGKDTRENVHKNYQIHRGLHVLIVNSKGEILIQKRSLKKDDRPGYYDASVGGQVRSGETYEQAALRETQEELGFTPEHLKKICDYKSYNSKQRENRQLFIYRYEGPFILDPDEVDSVAFRSLTDIQTMINNGEKFTRGFFISLDQYKKFLQRHGAPSLLTN